MISIIIPIYNSAKTLNRCFESLKAQTYRNFEVILVNDGSTDDTEVVCKKIAGEDGRFHYFYQDNGGVSKARNLGLMQAKGEWVTFVDADDWIEPNMLETMAANSVGVDIVSVNVSFDYPDRQVMAHMSKSPVRKCDYESFSLAILLPEASTYYDGLTMSVEITGSVCGGMVRRQILRDNDIQFAEGLPLGEDGLFWLKCFSVVKDFVIIDVLGYHYVIADGSANFRYRSDMETVNARYHDEYMRALPYVPVKYRQEYASLLYYRMYSNLRNLYIHHKDCPLSFVQKIKVLNHNISQMEVVKIKYGTVSKRMEMFLIRHRKPVLLFLLGKLVMLIKSFVK